MLVNAKRWRELPKEIRLLILQIRYEKRSRF